jgi:hypothetical protein
LDARIQMDLDRRMRDVLCRLVPRAEPRFAHAHARRPEVELGMQRIGPLGNVGQQQFDRHLLARDGPRAVRSHLHAVFRIAATGSGEHPFTFDFDHARAAISIRTHPLHVAESWDVDPLRVRGLEDRLIGTYDNGFSVEREGHHHSTSDGKYFNTDRTGLGAA